jgi:hypothetical protein
VVVFGPDQRHFAFRQDLGLLVGRDALIIGPEGQVSRVLPDLADYFDRLEALAPLSLAGWQAGGRATPPPGPAVTPAAAGGIRSGGRTPADPGYAARVSRHPAPCTRFPPRVRSR